jgi:hypothetical protein
MHRKMTPIANLPIEFLLATLSKIARKIVQRGLTFKLRTAYKGMLLIFNIKGHLKLTRILSHPQSARFTINHPELS